MAKKRKWRELSRDEQAEFKLHFVCTRDPLAAANHVGISAMSARRIIASHGLDELADIAEEQARERIAEDAADWKVEAVAQVDELLSILREGVHQLTAKAQIADVDKLIRLKAFLLGEADSRQEVNLNGGHFNEAPEHTAEVFRILDATGAIEAAVNELLPDAGE